MLKEEEYCWEVPNRSQNWGGQREERESRRKLQRAGARNCVSPVLNHLRECVDHADS